MKLANAVSTGSPPTVSQGSHVRSEHSHGCDQQPVELDPNSKTRKILVTMKILLLIPLLVIFLLLILLLVIFLLLMLLLLRNTIKSECHDC